MAAIFTTILLIFGFGALLVRSEVHSLDFEQYEITSGTGVYFEELSTLQLYNSEWTFVTYVNLTQFASETSYLENTVLKVNKFCDKIKEEFVLPIASSYCDHTIPQLHQLVEEIREFSTKWFIRHEFDGSSRHENEFNGLPRRRKRGFLGTITKQLFGTLSEDEGAFYMEQINALKSENFQHLLMTEKQTTLFQESLKVLNNTMQSQNIQKTALQNQFDDLSFVLKNASIEANAARVSSVLVGKLSELMQYTSFLIIGLREKQRYFFEAITSKSKSFQLIPPRVFMAELERVSLLVASQGLHLPLPLSNENLSKFYQMTTTEGRIVDNILIVRFSIPLVENQNFLLYKATSAPHRNDTNDTFHFIVPRNEYIGLDEFKEKFFTLTLDELRNCHRINGYKFLCKQSFPIMATNDNSGCEINLLRQLNATSNCDFRTANLTDELWVQLNQPNTYLYTLPKAQSVIVLCSHSRTSLILEGTGVISVAHKCRIKTDRIEIVAFQSIESKLFRNIVPSDKFNVNVTAEINKAKQMKSLRIPVLKLPNLIGETDPKRVQEINDDLANLQIQNAIDKASAMNILNTVINHGEGIGRALLALAIIVIAIVVVFTCIRYSIIKGGNILIFIVVVAIATALVLFIL